MDVLAAYIAQRRQTTCATRCISTIDSMFLEPQIAMSPTLVRPASARALYQSLLISGDPARAADPMREFLRQQIAAGRQVETDFPHDAARLGAWMWSNHGRVSAMYEQYLAERKAGGPRRYFSSRAHALYFLRSVAPTKLVDGAWLYAMTAPALAERHPELVKTYLEELGDGDPSKNHVRLYRRLLQTHGLEQWQDLPEACFVQGGIQLSLGYLGEEFTPEVIGFNLGYEQLPLHLLITAYELDEIGIDPYYFTLHVTVDNAHTGHACRAVQAALEACPPGDAEGYWRRVADGFRLNDLGAGTTDVIHSFDNEAEVVRILKQKSVGGHGAHSDYCKIAGRSVNDWLSDPEHIPYFLDALKRSGWIRMGVEPTESRFWHLLIGERAKMFGVFNPYEIQVIHDWLRGAASADCRPYDEAPSESRHSLPYRAIERRRAAATPRGTEAPTETAPQDASCTALKTQLDLMGGARDRLLFLRNFLSPLSHWKPEGLLATQIFAKTWTAA